MNALSAIEQSDVNPYIFSTEEAESQAKKEISSLYFWKKLMSDIPKKVGSVFSQHQEDMKNRRTKDIDKAEFDMFYEWLVRLQWFVTPYRLMAVSNAVEELL